MKKLMLKIMSMLVMVAIASLLIGLNSCKKDKDDDPIVIVLDGFYVKGESTAAADFNDKAIMKVTRNEVGQENRTELMEIYIAVKGGAPGFNIVEVAGEVQTTYGPGSDFALVPEAELDVEEPKAGLWRGTLAATDTKFVVPDDGLYHVMLDKELMIVAIAKVEWGVIGGATPGGWSESTPMPSAGFNLNAMTFEVAEVTLLENEWKFRYSNGWKIILDADFNTGGADPGVKVNTNFGGAINALVPGGDNLANDTYGVYKITMNWAFGTGCTAAIEWVKDGDPLPEYPDSLFMIGASVGGWDWATINLPMIPVHSHPELFWKIVWIDNGVTDAGFKFAPGREWVGDFGKTGDATDGVWAKGSENMPEPATSGFYMVVVDLENETIEVNAPTVYLIGDAAGSWDAGVAENLFTVDNANEKITITKDLLDGNLRMYTAASTLAADWWQAEFMILNNVIEFRATGGDQEAVPMTAGTHTIDLNFKTGAGSIN